VFPPTIPKEINKNTRYYSINQASKSMNPEGDWIGGAFAHPPQERKIWIRGHTGVERDNLSELNRSQLEKASSQSEEENR